MKLVKMKCPNCGSTFKVYDDAKQAECTHCGSIIEIPEKPAEVSVVRHKFNSKPLAVFCVVTAILVITAIIIVMSVIKKTDFKAYKPAGVYLVGKDIPAGEYILYPDKNKNSDETPVLEVRKTREPAIDQSDFLYRKEFYFRQYVNLNEGEYIAFEYAYLYLPEDVQLKPLGEGGYAAAQLKVGADIPAGEYVIVGSGKQTQYFITSKPEAKLYGTPALNSPDMLSFGYCENRIYLKVNDGEYLTFAGGRLYYCGQSPSPVLSDSGALPSGQYKVGIDIKSGKYTISAAENKLSQAWVCINKNSVDTGRIHSSIFNPSSNGAETLLYIRLEECTLPVEIEIPDPGDDELYVTFWYCYAQPNNIDD
ncbi:MAG: TFIIB-type zinc ribbon-containing protein [Clostridia bacterium]|nr:TFIIB-type zinc ribbon-containing protein [Clostridia bacterium]